MSCAERGETAYTLNYVTENCVTYRGFVKHVHATDTATELQRASRDGGKWSAETMDNIRKTYSAVTMLLLRAMRPSDDISVFTNAATLPSQ